MNPILYGWLCLLLLLKVSGVFCATPPNVILILTDDQDLTLGGMIPMTNTLQILANQGITFTNAFTSSPICCPSRASILTGQYAHNHLTKNNSISGGCYSKSWRQKFEINALPVFLRTKGYETFYAGKYLNKYDAKEIPPGWEQWFGLEGNSKYYDYLLNENGFRRKYENDYLTDVLTNHTMNFLINQSDSKPFFAMIAPPAPHQPATPAQRHSDTFANVRAPRKKNFNVPADEFDKHWLLRMTPSKLPDNILSSIDALYRKRWQSLLAVDEMIAAILQQLIDSHLIDNTFIIFTSDNGYHMGQFAQAYDKRQPYETDIRVPLIVRGPNVPAKTIADTPVALIDIFPTILDLAGIPKSDHLDGVSFASHLSESNENEMNDSSTEKRQILIEYWGEGNDGTYNQDCPWQKNDRLFGCSLDAACHCQDAWNNTYTCVRQFNRHENTVYCEFLDQESFVESYDLNADPYQLINVGFTMLPSEHAMYSLALAKLEQCVGDSCRKYY